MKVLTSFTHFKTGEGDRISYTYSEVDGDGNVLSQQNKGNFIMLDDQLKDCVETISRFIKENKLGGE
jgi:hypothetical protein